MKRVVAALLLLSAGVACTDSTGPGNINVPKVGAKLTISTLTAGGFDGSGGGPCAAFVKTTGTVRAVSQRAIVVTDDDSPAAFTTADYSDIAAEFDNVTYPTDVGYFGAPTDLDNNGHIIIYYTPSVNKLSPPGSATTSGYVGGFFFAGDLFDPSGSNACAASNKGEIFYLLTPDPSATFGNAFSVAFVRQVTRGTVAHEFQHMLNAGHRFLKGASFESTWLDEGMAHFAEEAVGRAATNVGDLQTLTATGLLAVDASAYNAFFIQNFARAKYYVSRPDTTGPIVGEDAAAANLSSRGASWALLRYAADWFSGGAPRTLTQSLAAGPDTGTTNLTTAAGVSLDTLLARWMVTMYTDHQSIAGLPAVYNFKGYEMRDIITRTSSGGLPSGSYLPVTTLGTGTANITANVPASSGMYFLVSTGTGTRTVRVTGTGTPSTSADATLSDLGTMAVGNVRVLTYGQAQNGLTIPSSLASAQYLIVVASVAANTDVISQYNVHGDWLSPNGLSGISPSVNPPTARQQQQNAATFTSVGGVRGAQFEAALRKFERTNLTVASSRGVSAQIAPPVRRAVLPPIDYVRLYVVRTQ